MPLWKVFRRNRSNTDPGLLSVLAIGLVLAFLLAIGTLLLVTAPLWIWAIPVELETLQETDKGE